MSAHLFDRVSIGPASLYAHEKQENLISADTRELAFLRYSIILTARWEASSDEDAERRYELRAELKDLRLQYSRKIDDIAMTFGIRSAMNAKEEVERTVVVPLDVDPDLFTMTGEDDEYQE
jgi:hypothetical protein